MAYQINCEICGTQIEAERRSKQYCAACRPKAVVLSRVVTSLNRALEADPVLIAALMNLSTNLPVDSRVRGLLAIPEYQDRLGVMTILNLAISEFGVIGWNGLQFEIVPWHERTLQSEVI